jgi:hypothetical protein
VTENHDVLTLSEAIGVQTNLLEQIAIRQNRLSA